MERLTAHSKHSGCPVPSKALRDICLEMDFCDEFDFCNGCPIAKLVNRLCEYEDTGLTPKQIENIKRNRRHIKCQRTIVGIPKAKKVKQKVSRYGLYINGKKYYLSDLVTYHFGEIVEIVINKQSNHARVFIGDTMIEEFDL